MTTEYAEERAAVNPSQRSRSLQMERTCGPRQINTVTVTLDLKWLIRSNSFTKKEELVQLVTVGCFTAKWKLSQLLMSCWHRFRDRHPRVISNSAHTAGKAGQAGARLQSVTGFHYWTLSTSFVSIWWFNSTNDYQRHFGLARTSLQFKYIGRLCRITGCILF